MSDISNEYRIVLSSVASIYDKPTFASELITQALFWESLEIYDKKDNWYKIKQRDGYVGWIHSFYTIDSSVYDKNELLQEPKNWYWVKNKFLSLTLNDSSNFLISFGSLIPCLNEEKKLSIILPNNEKLSIDRNFLTRFTDKTNYKEGVLHSSSQLLGIPYLWGGKSSFGFDCSGLVQSIVNMNNINADNVKLSCLERDTSKQVLSDILIQIENKPTVGDVIFFQSKKKIDHVGIYINNVDFIHSSGFVKVNSIDKKSKYYSSELEKKVYGVYRIK